MKIIHYTDVIPQSFDSAQVSGVAGRVVIGQEDGAANFCMRVFELSPDGYTPRHQHEWEHEIFFHAGEGEVYRNGEWQTVNPGAVVFIPGKEPHQIRNCGSHKLVFVCLIPSGAPEL